MASKQFEKTRDDKVLSAIVADSSLGDFKTFKATVSEKMFYRIVSDEEDKVVNKALSNSSIRIDSSGVADSGANINVTNRKIAAYYDLEMKLWEKPFQISFGNDSRFLCTHYVDFGPILGRAAIVDN